MINATAIGQELITLSSEEALKRMGEIFLPSILIAWFILLALTVLIAIKVLKKGWSKFFAIFILPQLIFLIFLVFTFIFPILPKYTGDWFTGWISP
jgi:hypothetical protein